MGREGKAAPCPGRHHLGAIPALDADMERGRETKDQPSMKTTTATRGLLFAGVLMAGALASPVAEADGWRGRGRGWGPPPRAYYHHHHNRGWNGAPVLGAIIGMGAGVAIGSALAAPPPPPVHYAPPPPPPVYYQPPPVVYQPPPVVYQPGPAWGGKPGW